MIECLFCGVVAGTIVLCSDVESMQVILVICVVGEKLSESEYPVILKSLYRCTSVEHQVLMISLVPFVSCVYLICIHVAVECIVFHVVT